MHTRNPITDKPIPQSPGMGKLGLGYGLRRNTPGLPVQNPNQRRKRAQTTRLALFGP